MVTGKFLKVITRFQESVLVCTKVLEKRVKVAVTLPESFLKRFTETFRNRETFPRNPKNTLTPKLFHN